MNNQKDIIKTVIIIRIILFFIIPAIIMVCYNYVGPVIKCLFVNQSKEESEKNFVEISYWQSLVLYFLTSILFKSVCL